MASLPTRVRFLKSKTTPSPFASDLINDSRPAISSSSIWPLSAKTTLPFADLSILNILLMEKHAASQSQPIERTGD